MFAPGSTSDLHARFISPKLTEQLGQSIIVDNKGGGGGIAAMRDVYRSQPMGYSVLLANGALVGNAIAFRDPGYKLEDYTPIGVYGQTFYGMIIHPMVPAKTLAEFVAYARANPDKLNYGALGPAAGSTLNAERFKQMAGIDMTGVPFKGGDPVSIALLAGDIQVYWATLNTARSRTQNKQIIALAVTSDQRTQVMPNVPTFRELGYPGMNASSWEAVFAPSAVPAAMLKRLRDAFDKAAATPDWKATVEKQEYEPWRGTADQFMARLREESTQLAADYKRLNIPLE